MSENLSPYNSDIFEESPENPSMEDINSFVKSINWGDIDAHKNFVGLNLSKLPKTELIGDFIKEGRIINASDLKTYYPHEFITIGDSFVSFIDPMFRLDMPTSPISRLIGSRNILGIDTDGNDEVDKIIEDEIYTWTDIENGRTDFTLFRRYDENGDGEFDYGYYIENGLYGKQVRIIDYSLENIIETSDNGIINIGTTVFEGFLDNPNMTIPSNLEQVYNLLRYNPENTSRVENYSIRPQYFLDTFEEYNTSKIIPGLEYIPKEFRPQEKQTK